MIDHLIEPILVLLSLGLTWLSRATKKGVATRDNTIYVIYISKNSPSNFCWYHQATLKALLKFVTWNYKEIYGKFYISFEKLSLTKSQYILHVWFSHGCIIICYVNDTFFSQHNLVGLLMYIPISLIGLFNHIFFTYDTCFNWG